MRHADAMEVVGANVFTLAEGSMSRLGHRTQEEVYLVLDVGRGRSPFLRRPRRGSTTTP